MFFRKTSVQTSIALSICLSATMAFACNVPVFRYALERWKPDLCEVIVFHDGKLSDLQEQQLQKLEKAASDKGGSANAEVRRSHVGHDTDRKRKDLWATFQDQPDVTLPYVVIRTSLGNVEVVNHWHGSLETASTANLFQSPIRRELSKRLLAGDSVVWLMLQSKDSAKNDSTRQLLTKELDRLSKKLELPDGIGLPGSELYAEVPLFLKFTILEIDPTDVQEQVLFKLMSGFEPDSQDEPLLAPVFGRGRALEVIPAKQVDAGLIEDLTMFLCGACSCQVKERNPGFDLLLSTNWNQELYGADGEAPPPVTTLERTPATQPLLTIPPGRKK
ncbi:MAG: hypothetical protein WCK15_03365 [Pirellula sp.]